MLLPLYHIPDEMHDMPECSCSSRTYANEPQRHPQALGGSCGATGDASECGTDVVTAVLIGSSPPISTWYWSQSGLRNSPLVPLDPTDGDAAESRHRRWMHLIQKRIIVSSHRCTRRTS